MKFSESDIIQQKSVFHNPSGGKFRSFYLIIIYAHL